MSFVKRMIVQVQARARTDIKLKRGRGQDKVEISESPVHATHSYYFSLDIGIRN